MSKEDAYAYEEISINGYPALKLADGRILQIPAGGEGEGDAGAGGSGDATTGAEGDAGGGSGNTEAELKAIEAELESASDDDDGDAGEKNADGTAKPSRLQRRIKALTEKAKGYAKFGKPDELAKRLQRLDEYEKIERQMRTEQKQKQTEQRREDGSEVISQKMRNYLDTTYGQGASTKFEQLLANDDARATREARAYAKTGQDHIVSLMTEAGLDSSDAGTVEALTHTMATYLHANPELHDRYLDPQGQREALKEAFGFTAKKLFGPVLAAAGAGAFEEIARRKSRALGSARGSSAGPAVEIDDEKPPANATLDQRNAWHKARASRAWDRAIEADEASVR